MGDDSVKQYFESLYLNEDELLLTIETYASGNRIPIMEKDSIEFLKQLIRIHQPKHILEVGTAIGYSAIQMANAAPIAKITTIEIDEKRYDIALKNIKEANLEDRVHVVLADAKEYLQQLPETTTFDFAFIDAAKGQYQAFFELIDPFMSQHGLIVTDNILLRGYVINQNTENKRLNKLGRKVDLFNKWLISNNAYDTTFVETGDGIAISRKK